MQDFMKVESVSFPKSGGHTTPKHSFSDFTFRYLHSTGHRDIFQAKVSQGKFSNWIRGRRGRVSFLFEPSTN